MAAATAFHAPATPTIVSHYQPDPTYAYEVRGLAYDGTPEPAVTLVVTAATPDVTPPPSSVMDTEVVAAVTPATLSIPALICSYGWDCATALRIARCESGLSPTATNGRFKGLFQLDTYNGGWFAHFGYDVSQWAMPEVNVAVAYALWSAEGWRPWSCK